MEPTGTYGDALRHQCHALGLPVHMMPPKHSHDFAEVLDGVPSMHDPKAASRETVRNLTLTLHVRSGMRAGTLAGGKCTGASTHP